MNMGTTQQALGFQPPATLRRDKHTCNCRNSKCLKLYCECFASGDYCHNCNCSGCYNIAKFETHRIEAIHNILERNPLAFRRKSAHYAQGTEAPDMAKHYKGCACKRSGCLKKYCECFQAGISCSAHCKCTDWYGLRSKNLDDFRGTEGFDGSDDSRPLPTKRIKVEADVKAPMELPFPASEFIARCLVLPQKVIKTEEVPAESSLLCDEEPIANENLSTLSIATSSDSAKTFACSALYKQHEAAVYAEVLRMLESI